MKRYVNITGIVEMDWRVYLKLESGSNLINKIKFYIANKH